MEDPIELRKGFERAGRAAVRVQQEANRAAGAPMQDREIEARKWLHERDEADALAAAEKRDLREEETLSIARQALGNSKRANKIAWLAIVFATITALIIAAVQFKLGKS